MKNHILVPLAIVLAGGLIAVAVYFVNKQQPGTNTNKPLTSNDIRPVDSTDHLLGSPTAPIKLIEYSDFECPYCKVYQGTLHQIMDDYGAKGQVAWVFRHFPIYELHSKAPKEAEAAECAADQGGNDAFWKFIDQLYQVTPSNNGLDLKVLPEIAGQIGLDKAKFVQCLDSGKFKDKVQAQREEIMKTGAQGTPHLVIEVGGSFLPLPGAQPIGALRSAINELLKQTGADSGASSTPSQ
jgi:protein-disulfide isomerase